MRVLRKAACAAIFFIATTTLIGCGNVYRPVALPLPSTTGNPAGPETEVVLSCCLSPTSLNAAGPIPSSVLTEMDVSGDTNMGNKVIANVVGSVVAGTVPGALPGSTVNLPASPMAFDYLRSSVFTANTATDSVTQLLLSNSTSGFSANVSTLSLEPGSAPIGMSFQYFGGTYTQNYVVNSGTTTSVCPGTGSIGALLQPSAQLKATICIEKVGPPITPANPVYAWIYRDQSKVFVLDNQATGNGNVYVVSASKYEVTNSFPVGVNPTKAAQSNDGNYIYVLNTGSASISIIDGATETVTGPAVSTDNPLTSSPPIDIAQDTNFNDTSANSQINHLWILHADGTVSVWDGTVPGQLAWITSIATITPSQLANGAYPTNLALMRDGTEAYVGIGNTDQMVGINTSALGTGVITMNATTSITVGTHRSVLTTINGLSVVLETTTPTVSSVAVSREGTTSDLSKAYATTTTTTTYNYYDSNGKQTSTATYPNLYNGVAVVSAAAVGQTPINTYLMTLPAPLVVTYCNAPPGVYDGQKNCPAQVPVMVLGRS